MRNQFDEHQTMQRLERAESLLSDALRNLNECKTMIVGNANPQWSGEPLVLLDKLPILTDALASTSQILEYAKTAKIQKMQEMKSNETR